ncbi:uncharacterized protein LOC114173991 isoform X2 [Vigna unguiculata]|uniref:uncharacterized protein LOC114173991 isoform X2 n=1 Tax=Vigna unguiculata TaxID=3917 RepID=UPI0010170411|nr:uncharacterized protein LOC114173991 isoform X2 [Vigna unguiculata]
MMLVKKAVRKLEKRPAEAPKTSMDMVFTFAEAIRFGYADILGKWNLLDLPRAILYGIMEKGKKTVAIECKERDDCVQLTDPELLKELYELKKCLTRTMLFSDRRFRSFLFAAGFVKEDVLLRKRRARILKPAFTVIRDKESKCLFVFIRGTRSIKDTLTDVIGAPVSFNHFICSDGELKRNNVVSGHGHRGMVAAARWIKKHCTPKLLDELRQYPDFQVKIVGHSLGGGTAAILTYMLREIKQFASCTCVTFGSAACMSLEMAEFGKPFVTSIGLIKRKKFISSAYSAIESRLSFASSAKAFADQAVSRGTEVVMSSKQRTQSLISWPRREKTAALTSSKSANMAEASESLPTSYEAATEELTISEFTSDEDDGSKSTSEGSDNDGEDEEEEQIISSTPNTDNDELNQYLKELQLEAQDDNPNTNGAKEKEEATKKGITEAEMNDEVVPGSTEATSEKPVKHYLYPSGRILHIVPVISSENSESNHNDDADEKRVVLYETPRKMYGKLRLSISMLHHHKTGNYLKVLQRLINQLEKEKSRYGA